MQKRQYVNIFTILACMLATATTRADNAYYTVNMQADIVTVAARILYAQDIPYVSMDDVLDGLGGTIRISEKTIDAACSGATAVLKLNDVAVAVPGRTFSLIHPARVHEGGLYLSQADIIEFFARAYNMQIAPATPTTTPPELTPVVPDAPALDEDPGLLLETLTLPAVATDITPEVEEAAAAEEKAIAPPPGIADEETSIADDSSTERAPYSDVVGSIVLDAGHGGKDAGIVGDNITEKEFALDIVMNLRRILKETTKLTIHCTREADKDLSPSVRTKTANAVKGDLLLSIHAAYAATHHTGGITIFTDQSPNPPQETLDSEMRRQLAARRTRGEQAATTAYHIAQTLVEEGALGPVTVRTAPLILQRLAEMPCILIELCYLSNPETVMAAGDETYREQTAQTLARAIATALNQPME